MAVAPPPTVIDDGRGGAGNRVFAPAVEEVS